MSRAAFAIVLGAALVAACATDDPADDDIPESQLEHTLFVSTMKSTRTFNFFATDGGGFGQSGRLLKYFIDVRNGSQATFFINANYRLDGKIPSFATLHYDFAKVALAIGDDQASFNTNTYYSDDKRYIGGSIQTYTLGNDAEPTYAIQFYPDDVVHEEGILRTAQILKPRIKIPNAKLAFVATGPQQTFARVGPALRAMGVTPMTIDEVLGNVRFLPLNAGEAWGYLRIFPRDQGDLRPTDIPVFDELPLDLSVVAGTITRAYQDVTSHVNLKSKERGTPNMMLRDASPTHPQLAPLADRPVHLVVQKTGYVIEPTTAEMVERKYRERTDKPWIPLPQIAYPNVLSFDAMCPALAPMCVEDGGRFGGKANGIGFLVNDAVVGRFGHAGTLSSKMGYDVVPFGFGVPVQRYRNFIAANPDIATALAALIADEKAGHLSPNERRARATAVQQLFYFARVPQADLVDVERELVALSARFPAMSELKFRSSANAEDIPSFDGAGLHDSFSVKLSAQDNNALECYIQDDPDGVVTKLKVLPKTPQCAIKAVYASLWNPRAIEERSFARIDHATAAMGLAVVPAYETDAEVMANGVIITRIINGQDINGYTVSVQEGNNLVTNPTPGTIAQMSVVTFSADLNRPDRYTMVRAATPMPGGATRTTPVLSDAKMAEIVAVAVATERQYCATKASYNPGSCAYIHMNRAKPSALDMEFKVLTNGRVVVKQVREFHGI